MSEERRLLESSYDYRLSGLEITGWVRAQLCTRFERDIRALNIEVLGFEAVLKFDTMGLAQKILNM